MSLYISNNLQTQNDLLLNSLIEFYKDEKNVETIMNIINGESKISLRIVDWFVTNYAKKFYTIYDIHIDKANKTITIRFKVFNDYKLKLKAYSKKRFDPFCRWERTNIPYKNNTFIQTTIGQLNFFKWALENEVITYIEKNYENIENDMNKRNSSSRKKTNLNLTKNNNTRKKREELSISAAKTIKKENVEIVVKFN